MIKTGTEKYRLFSQIETYPAPEWYDEQLSPVQNVFRGIWSEDETIRFEVSGDPNNLTEILGIQVELDNLTHIGVQTQDLDMGNFEIKNVSVPAEPADNQVPNIIWVKNHLGNSYVDELLIHNDVTLDWRGISGSPNTLEIDNIEAFTSIGTSQLEVARMYSPGDGPSPIEIFTDFELKNGKTLIGIPDPVTDDSAVNKLYLDSKQINDFSFKDNTLVNWTSGLGGINQLSIDDINVSTLDVINITVNQMTGKNDVAIECLVDLDLTGKRIYGLPDPVYSGEATNKYYVDSQTSLLEDKLKILELKLAQI